MMKSCKYLTVLLFLAVMGGTASAAPVLQMHRAVYDLSLGRLEPVSDVSGIDGRMVVEWRGGPTCGGYTSTQRVVTRVTGVEGSFVSNDIRLSYFEAADGSEFTFTRTEYTNGELTDQDDGTARREKNNEIKILREGSPARSMPGEVLFPMEYNLAMIEKAQKGERVFTQALFDGTEERENPTTIFIGKSVPDQADKAAVAAQGEDAERLKGEPHWPVRISYFEPEDREGVPSFEMGFALFSNGISTELRLDYPDLEIKGALREIDYFPAGEC
jgi:hypothetical protein